MPYKLEEDNGGYYVVNEQTGKRKNKTPISKGRAVKYMRALYAVESGTMKEYVLTTFKREFDKNTGGGVDRDELDSSDFVDPEKRRFPIVTAADVMDAVHSYGRAKPAIPFDEFKSRLIAIAKRKGFTASLPKDWEVEEKEAHPALMVYKDAAGAGRWVLFSSNAYQDRDKEIVSQAALEADVARADKEHNYGPLRWWHVGKPDPIKQEPGPGADLGACDFRALHGRMLVESGTFNSAKVAEAVKKTPQLQVSLGFFHPRTQPDAAGVFHEIKTFERSILPAGRASNQFTAIPAVKTIPGGDTVLKEKFAALKALLNGDEELTNSILALAEAKEKEAQDQGVAFKEVKEEAETEAITEKDEPQVDAVLEMATEIESVEEFEEVELEPTIGDLSPDAFTGLLAEAMGKAMEPYQKELKEVQASIKMKDDSEAALRAAVETQAQTITTLKSQLEELLGQQPRVAKQAYRDSQSAETVVKDDSRVKGKQPTVDPAFIQFVNPLGGS